MNTSTLPESSTTSAPDGTDRKSPREGIYIKQIGSTHPAESEDVNQYNTNPSFNTQVHHFRLAFAIVGTLVASGSLPIDFDEKDWHLNFEVTVLDVAAVLNYHDF
jgi:hypothetical protein